MRKCPTYKRQRLCLFLLEAVRVPISKIDFQKLLFLYHQEINVNHYAFIPYHYGCYSILCKNDLSLLSKENWIVEEGDNISLSHRIDLEPWAKNNAERRNVSHWVDKNPVRGDDLIRRTYLQFPYYAINSKIKNRILNTTELKSVDSVKNLQHNDSQNIVFTIGYEGIHFEEYLNKLIKNNIKTLCDVRRNPLSRKFGFSSTMLSKFLPKLGIKYLHLGELGIATNKRKTLKNITDYEALFREYQNELPQLKTSLKKLEVCVKKSRVALTCFEAQAHNCHRHCISDYLKKQLNLEVEHL